ncbi:MAG: hypothetical protein HUJ26_09860 [Planctomycetaceae bacterium]|nr:hypothetical protein [Planctomycetaceae bacterium]
MSRSLIIQTVVAVWLTAFLLNGAEAQLPQVTPAGHQYGIQPMGGVQPNLLPTHTMNYGAMRASQQQGAATPPSLQPAPGQMINAYPQTGAALYPSPIPNVPHQVGGTMHTNQAFYPHEMLYKHRYQAMYPPFYYVVKGGWIVTPWGVRSNDVWHLTGTKVDVKYKPKHGILSGFNGFKR